MESDHGQIARRILDANEYVTLGTADEAGRPWSSPVYFTSYEYKELYWISSPSATHSHNITVRSEIGAVVFDSQAPPLTGQAVYMSAIAAEMTGHADFDQHVERFNFARYAEPTLHGLKIVEPADVLPPSHLRLYRAIVSQHFILDPDADTDTRVAVEV